jgi:hypothetical protein
VDETPEQRASRLAKRSEWQRESLRRETPERRAKRLEYKKGYRLRNLDKLNAYKEKWLVENRDRELSGKRDYAAKKRAEERQKKATAERSKKWAVANPEKRRDAQRAWREANPEKQKAAARAWLAANRERHNANSRAWRAANPAARQPRTEHDLAQQRVTATARRRDPERGEHDRELRRNRRRLQAKLANRIAELGLPAPRPRRVPVTARTANEAAARTFFEQIRVAREVRSQDIRRYDAEAYAFRHAVTMAAVQERLHQYLSRHAARIRRETQMDSRAREVRGAQPLNIEREVLTRAWTELDPVRALRAEAARVAVPHEAARLAALDFGAPPTAATAAPPTAATGRRPIDRPTTQDRGQVR